MENIVRRELIRHYIMRHIFCPITGVVLDLDTCTVIDGPDGLPAICVSPETGRNIAALMDDGVQVFSPGYTIDKSTVREA